jgi:hypothetical protein
MRTLLTLLTALTIGCLPRAQPLAPQTTPAGPQAQTEITGSPSQNTRGAEALLSQAPMTPQPSQQPYPQPSQQPYPQPRQQPYPQPGPQPYPQPGPQPYPQPGPQPYPQPGPQPYPQPSQPYPQPQPYAPPQPYAAPQPYPAPTGTNVAMGRSHVSDGEVIADFAALGSLASIEVLVRQDVNNGSAGTFLVFAGLAGGGATGWLLTENYPVDPGTAHATTIGLLAGAANGALLIQPTHANDADQVLGLLLLGSAIGTTGGFVYGQSAHLTPGQSTFVGNVALLGSATAAFGAIAGSRDGKYGTWENGTLALGLDAGVLGGALIAPALNWSPRRAKFVFASTAIGAFLGGMIVSLIAKPKDSNNSSGDLVAGCMTGGMWGGFGVGILMTKDAEPDFRFSKPAPGSAVTVAPFAGDRGQVGLMAGGSW